MAVSAVIQTTTRYKPLTYTVKPNLAAKTDAGATRVHHSKANMKYFVLPEHKCQHDQQERHLPTPGSKHFPQTTVINLLRCCPLLRTLPKPPPLEVR